LAIFEEVIVGLISCLVLELVVFLVGVGVGSFLVQMLAQKFEREYLLVESLINADSEQVRHSAVVCFPAYVIVTMLS
jgi:hypothetical protein